MAEYTHNENLFEAQTSSLMDRLQGYFDDISLWSHHDSTHVGHLFKFRSLVLLAEMYEYVRFFFVYRESRLSEYFSGQTLCQSLEKVVFIEKLQDNIRKLGFDLSFLDTYSLMHNAMLPDLYTAIDMFKVLHEKGIDELCTKLTSVQMPSVNKSVLWDGDGKSNRTHNFERVFRKAKENMGEDLGKQIVRKVIPPEKFFLDEEHEEKFNFREFIVDMQQKANEATVEDITENPKNIQFKELAPEQLVQALPDVDIAVINGNYAIEGGLSVKDALAVEANDGLAAKTYGNIVATSAEKENDEALKALVSVLQSKAIADYINETYDGAVVPLY